MRIPGTAGYDEAAADLVVQYEAVTFAEVHGDALHLVPAVPSRVLDIGAGTGRDAAALAKAGHQVTAVEPAAGLRAQGQALHADQDITWIDDHLPDLVSLGDRRFELILLTAVWMHLTPAGRAPAMRRLAALLASNGTAVMVLRHGPIPAGRHMFDIPDQQTADLAQACGLSIVHRSGRPDLHGRADVRMTTLGLRALAT
ncbi:class I SAM-dependent methyltransferase [Actinomadura violacea]|uniref:Class I SAM-dependent methyltransferase n=1 Tax=Actinomadura violacea TaxID=2819934 RepID=A0ABS3RJZ7_9ACTN|nr:class I SAM-dependent methyltransferase [Actinomadura violacea]MBO2456903.1 class I SAM-dependent methyltransferase [Actinomadura violacea]